MEVSQFMMCNRPNSDLEKQYLQGDLSSARVKSLRKAEFQRRRTVSFSGKVRRRSTEEREDSVEPETCNYHEAFQEQRRRKHSGYSFTSDLPEQAVKFRSLLQSLLLKLSSKSDELWAQFVSWFLLGMVLWVLFYLIFEERVWIHGDLFKLMVLILTAFLVGRATELLGIPGLLGMLVTGVVLRNIQFYHPAAGVYKDLTNALKHLATTVGMVRAGMRLIPDAMYVALHCHNGLRLTALGMIPSFLEAMVTTIITYFLLNYPATWAVSLGFLLCPNSPSVITPPMQKLMDAGYGEEKHIGALVHGAAGLDVAFSVSIFDICLSLLFHRRDLPPLKKLAVGSLDVFVDITGGIVLGLIAGLLPIQDNELAVWKRTIMVMAAGMLSITAGPDTEVPGTGPLSCIITSFVASMLWKLQAPLTSKCTVNDIMQGMWVILCPMLFVFTGSDVDISVLTWQNTAWMGGIVLVTVIVRLLGCFLVLFGGEFNCKEMLFVGLIFQGKATNQAALAPQILYAGMNSHYPDDEIRGIESISMGVLSILICTPIAHLGAKLLGPHLLSKKKRAISPHPSKATQQTENEATPSTKVAPGKSSMPT